MKRLTWAITLVWACAVTMGLNAQKPTSPPKMPGKTPTKMAGPAHVAGPISGAPTGKTFVVASGRKRTTVDASKATIRNHGKFASASDLRSGTFVTVDGTMNGNTLMATQVDIKRQPGDKGKGGMMGKGGMSKNGMTPPAKKP